MFSLKSTKLRSNWPKEVYKFCNKITLGSSLFNLNALVKSPSLLIHILIYSDAFPFSNKIALLFEKQEEIIEEEKEEQVEQNNEKQEQAEENQN